MTRGFNGLSPESLSWSDARASARATLLPSNPVKLVAGGLAAADVAVILGTSCAAFILRHGFVLIPLAVALATLLAGLVTLNVLRLSGCYTKHLASRTWFQIAAVCQGWSAVFLFLVVVAFLTRTSDDFSRVWAFGWYGGALAGLSLVRVAAIVRLRGLRRSGKLAETIAVVDLDGRGPELARHLMRGGSDVRLLGMFSPAHSQGGCGGMGRSGIEALVELARLFRVDEIIISVSGDSNGALGAVVAQLHTIPATVRLQPILPALALASPDATLLFGRPMLTISRRPLGDWERVIKRAEDLVLSLAILLFVTPVLFLTAVAIKLDTPGPVLFRQARHGFNNNVITVYKFRTMLHRATAEAGVPQARRADARVTRVGRFLRRTSLDELPQLLNVLKGDMSLVGPRPHAVAHNEQYAEVVDNYLSRHRMQPGITGWAQVNGFRGETDSLYKMQRRVEYDLAYINNWSLASDLKIIIMTIVTSAFDRNAY